MSRPGHLFIVDRFRQRRKLSSDFLPSRYKILCFIYLFDYERGREMEREKERERERERWRGRRKGRGRGRGREISCICISSLWSFSEVLLPRNSARKWTAGRTPPRSRCIARFQVSKMKEIGSTLIQMLPLRRIARAVTFPLHAEERCRVGLKKAREIHRTLLSVEMIYG